MQSLPSDMSELLAVAEVAHRDIGDAHCASELLQACEPSLLLIADTSGNVVFADVLSSETDVDIAPMLALDLAKNLAEKQACRLEVHTDTGCELAFGIRLPDSAGAGISGCLVRSSDSSAMAPDETQASQVVCAAFGWAAGYNKTNDSELRTRVAHLQAEHDTLKNSQDQAIAGAIEEREMRLQQQRQDMAQLEAVMKLAADGILTVNEAGLVESFNEAAGRSAGSGTEDGISRPVGRRNCSRDQHAHAVRWRQHPFP